MQGLVFQSIRKDWLSSLYECMIARTGFLAHKKTSEVGLVSQSIVNHKMLDGLASLYKCMGAKTGFPIHKNT